MSKIKIRERVDPPRPVLVVDHWKAGVWLARTYYSGVASVRFEVVGQASAGRGP